MIRRLTLQGLPRGLCGQLRTWRFTAGQPGAALHTHDFHELFWVEEGRGRHLVNGEARPLVAGDLVLVAPDDVHGFEATHPPFVISNFAFASAIWRRLHRRLFDGAPVLFAAPFPGAREHHPAPAVLGGIRAAARALAGGALDELAVEAALLPALVLLHRQGGDAAAGRAPAWLVEACARMQEPRYFRGGVGAFVKLAGYSGEHLARSARRHLGKSPTELVNEARLTFAARQLATTARPIPEIVHACGLENVGHFYRLFRARFGVSPARYRAEGWLPL